MTDANRITLELEGSAERIAGLITIRGGTPQRFTGYVELIAALEGVRSRSSAGTEAPRGTEPPDTKGSTDDASRIH